jgi:D-amino-acid oxidase
MIPRPAPSGEALVGGTYMVNDWNVAVDWDIARKMFDQAKTLIPALSEPDVYIKQHNVGLRPAREGGPRVETEIYTWPKKNGVHPRISQVEGERKTLVLHAYGFGCVAVLLLSANDF